MSGSKGSLNLLTKNRNFLLLFFGRLVSSVGTAIFTISILWSAATEIGGVAAVSAILSTVAVVNIIFSPFAGVWADRWKKRNILVITDITCGVILLLLGSLFGTYLFQIWVLILVIFGLQICGSLFGPALLSLIPVIADDKDLSQANALISMTDRLSQIIGMAIGGVLISLVGIKGAIFIDAITFILSAVSEMFINIEEINKKEVKTHKKIRMWPDIKDGFKVIWSNIELKWLILLDIIDDFFGATIFVFLPILADQILKVGSTGYGIMQAMLGVGSLISALVLSFVKEIKMKYTALTIAGILSGLSLISLGIANGYLYALFSLLILGIMLEIVNVNENLIIQRRTPKDTRGRVFALRFTMDNSLRPFSFALAGVLATIFPLQNIFIVFGLISSIIGLMYIFIPIRLKKQEISVD